MVSYIKIDNYYIDLLLCQKQLFFHHCELNLFAKLTSKTPKYQSKRIDSVYINHSNSLRESIYAQSIFPNLVRIPKPMKAKHIQNIH